MTSHYQFCVTLSTVTLLSGLPRLSMATVRGTYSPAIYEGGARGAGAGFWLAGFVLGDHILASTVDSHGP